MSNEFLGITVDNVLVPGVLLLVGATGTAVVTSFFRGQDRRASVKAAFDKEHSDMKRQIDSLVEQLKALKDSVQPISMAFQQFLIKELTHFHEKRTDELLEKMGPPYILTDAEEKEVVAALDKRIKEAAELMTESELDAARMLPMMIRRVKAELAMGIPAAPPPDLKLVVVPSEPKP